MTVYYNEFDPYAAAMLRNLITAGHIADGVVDTRSIEDVRPSDLAGFAQCHFFAGVGVWSYALRRAGWPDDRPVWTGSCPCQPFSAAGKGLAFADERHLWPAFGHLIRECKPAVVLGEQVASKDVDAWIDLVHADLEAMGYAFGSVPFPSAGVGAPHIRDRNYWVANANDGRRQRRRASQARDGRDSTWLESERLRNAIRLAHTDGRDASAEREQRSREQRQQPEDSSACGLADTERARVRRQPGGFDNTQAGAGDREHLHDPVAGGDLLRPGPTNGFWRDADWLGCTDGKWRPVMPGTFPLVNGAAARVGRLRAYGNAINAEAARVFIEAVMECQP